MTLMKMVHVKKSSRASVVSVSRHEKADYLQPATEMFHVATIRCFSNQREAVGTLR